MKIKKPQTDSMWRKEKPVISTKKIKEIITRKEKEKTKNDHRIDF